MNIMNLEEYKGVYVFAEQVDNKLSGIAFELLGKAKDLAADLNAEVAAVLIGSDVKGLADELAAYGADKVIVVDDPELKEQARLARLKKEEEERAAKLAVKEAERLRKQREKEEKERRKREAGPSWIQRKIDSLTKEIFSDDDMK